MKYPLHNYHNPRRVPIGQRIKSAGRYWSVALALVLLGLCAMQAVVTGHDIMRTVFAASELYYGGINETAQRNELKNAEQKPATVCPDTETQKRLESLLRQDAWERASQQGRCHVELLAIIRRAYDRSEKRVPLRIVERLAWRESNCQCNKISPRGAVGLFQIIPVGGITEDVLLDPEANAEHALEKLDQLMAETGDLRAALLRWNNSESFAEGLLK